MSFLLQHTTSIHKKRTATQFALFNAQQQRLESIGMRVYLAHRSRVVAVVAGKDNAQYIICYRGYALYFINARALHTLNIQLRYNLRITNTTPRRSQRAHQESRSVAFYMFICLIYSIYMRRYA